MNCEKCGQIVNRTDELCEHCGASLSYSEMAQEPQKIEDSEVEIISPEDLEVEIISPDENISDEFEDDFKSEPNWTSSQNKNMPPLKKRWIAILLLLFLGGLGIHRIYLGLYKSGLALFVIAVPLGILTGGLTEIIVLVWLIYDLVMLILKRLEDAYGRPVGVYND